MSRNYEIMKAKLDGFTEALKVGGRIEIRGYGIFSVRKYDSHKGRNPKIGKIIDVKPKRLPYFKVGKELKEKVIGQ